MVGALFLCGCATTAVRPTHYPSSAKDWNGVDSVEFLQEHPGSRAARYWAGFGAGSAWVKINGEIVDAKTGNALLRFAQQRVGAMGLFGGA